MSLLTDTSLLLLLALLKDYWIDFSEGQERTRYILDPDKGAQAEMFI